MSDPNGIVKLTKGKLMLIITFETWEEYDEAIASIATAYLPEAE